MARWRGRCGCGWWSESAPDDSVGVEGGWECSGLLLSLEEDEDDEADDGDGCTAFIAFPPSAEAAADSASSAAAPAALSGGSFGGAAPPFLASVSAATRVIKCSSSPTLVANPKSISDFRNALACTLLFKFLSTNVKASLNSCTAQWPMRWPGCGMEGERRGERRRKKKCERLV